MNESIKLPEEISSLVEKTMPIFLDVIKTDEHHDEKLKNLNGRLNSKSAYSAVTELEWVAHLKSKFKTVQFEPLFPEEGPDIKVNCGDGFFVEVTTLNLSKRLTPYEYMMNSFVSRIRKIPSNHYVYMDIRHIITESEIKYLEGKIKELIADAAASKIPNTIYYFSEKEICIWAGFDGLNYPTDLNKVLASGCKTAFQTYPMYFRGNEAKVAISVIPAGKEQPYTYVGGGYAFSGGDEKRIRKALNEKLGQIPKDSKSVVVIDISNSFTDEIDFENALDGSAQVTTRIEKETGKMIESYWNRAKNGFFDISKTISAVIVQKRIIKDGTVSYRRILYKNPNARNPLGDDILNKLV